MIESRGMINRSVPAGISWVAMIAGTVVSFYLADYMSLNALFGGLIPGL